MRNALIPICLLFATMRARAVDIVNDNPNARCEYVELFDDLRVYRDPKLFVPELEEQLRDRKHPHAPRRIDDIVRTTLKGKVAIFKIGEPYEFKGFPFLERLYETADPRLKTSPLGKGALVQKIQVCSEGAENSTLGFVLVDDLKEAQIYHQKEATLPPSVHEIPLWRDTPTDHTR